MYYTKKIPEPFGNRPQKSISIPIKTAEKIEPPPATRKDLFSPLAILLLFGNILKKGDE